MLHLLPGRHGFSAIGASVLAITLAAQPAHAQFWENLFGIEPDRPRKSRPVLPRRAPQSHERQHDATAEPQIKATQYPLVAVVSIASQRLAIYDSTGAVLHSRVSTGQEGHRTPFGVFKVIQKDRYHESNIYSGAPMPYMQRITWSGIALHAGYLPGYPASHGCIRMPEDVASDLFAATKLGMLVVVSPNDVTAMPFTHPALPAPLMLAAAAPSGVILASSTGADANPHGDAPSNPHDRAIEHLPLARKAATDAVKAAKAALEASQLASAEANKAAADLKVADSDVATAAGHLAAARAAEAAATTDDQRSAATKAVGDAEVQLRTLTARRDEARAIEAAKSQLAFGAANAWRTADGLAESSAAEAKQAAKAVEPLSIFISRKEGRLFARQGFTPMFDAPVTFKGEGPLGTHVYTVMAADEKTGQLSWQSITVPASAHADHEPRTSRKDPGSPPIERLSATASEALDRVEMGTDLRQKLNARVWLGASLIISDNGLGEETGTDTDFVVQTR